MFPTPEDEKKAIEGHIYGEINKMTESGKNHPKFSDSAIENWKTYRINILAGCRYHIKTYPDLDGVLSKIPEDKYVNGIINKIGCESQNIMGSLLGPYMDPNYSAPSSVATIDVIEYRMKLRGYVLNEKKALFERPKSSEPSPDSSAANPGQ